MADVTQSMEGLKVVPNTWPINGNLVSITNTPSYRSGKVAVPVRNALADTIPVAPVTQSKLPLPDTIKVEGTPSPKKVVVKKENLSPTKKENTATPGSKK